MRVRALVAAAVGGVLALTGCAGSGRDAPGGRLTVFAAASLTEAFTEIGDGFERSRPGTEVVVNFAGSSALANQINQGAPADVFASANPATMRTVTAAGGAAGEPVVFARNRLVIAVPKGNPLGVRGLADLARPGLTVALCAEQVPCGAAARQALSVAAVPLTPVTLEPDVRAALTRVELGEVDAALVYRTDVAASPSVTGVEFPESASAVNDYLVVALAEAPDPAAADAFVAYLLSARGAAVLAAAGFETPAGSTATAYGG